jgi:prepilin-type N-terminal cleavage/methylation domain-containing protein
MPRSRTVLVSALAWFLWALAPSHVQASDSISDTAGDAATVETVATVTEPPSSTGDDLREALAQVVVERNAVTSQRDSLLGQRWLIVTYAAMVSFLALWFMRLFLQRARSGPAPAPAMADMSMALATAPPRKRTTNATITIRNPATQQPEIVDRVATRRFFRQRSAAVVPPVATATPPAPLPVVGDYAPTDAPVGRTGRRADPVRAGTDVIPQLAAEPETTNVRIARRDGRQLSRQGLSLLEVMIALAVLATVLSSVGGGIFVLSSARRVAEEESTVHALLRSWSERLIGADWEWLGREHLDDPLHGAWSWQRPETTAALAPGDHPPLREKAPELSGDATRQLLDDQPSGLEDLRCHLEYYRPTALELCFAPFDGSDAHVLWDEVRPAYRLTPPIDLRQHLDAVVIRLSAMWRAHDGGQRRQDLVFVRAR